MSTDPRPDPLAFLGEELDDLRNRHLYRPLRVMSSGQGPIVSVDDRRLISLSSNDYLGLTHHPRLREAALADDTGKQLENALAELNLLPGGNL